jgi:mono/diheme cytochrome c family protein
MKRATRLALALGATLGAAATAAPVTDYGRQNYLLHCSGCHLPDGTGSAANEVPTLHGVPGHFASVPEGRAFLTQVPGIAYSSLSDAEVAEILNWSLIEFSRETLPQDFQPFTTEEVSRLRAVRPAEIFKVRAEVLELLRRRGVTIEY